MRRIFHAGDVEILVDVEVLPGRRYRWAYDVPMLGLAGTSDIPLRRVDAAFEAAERVARYAIAMRLGD